MANITLQGNPISTSGELPEVGSIAPDFKLTDADLNDVSLVDFGNKKKLIDIVVSLDTSICIDSAKKFGDHSRDDTVILVVSADLPFAQARACGAANAANVKTLSMMRDKNFAKDYGVLLQDGPLRGLIARAVVVLDGNNRVLYTEQVPEIAQEPDYDKALAALG